MSVRENTRIELKRKLTKRFENEAIAFLNYHDGGIIYVGIDDDGTIVGINDPDSEMLKIKDRLKNNILPSAMGLFDVMSEKHEGTVFPQREGDDRARCVYACGDGG